MEIIAKRDNKTVYRDGDKTLKIFSPDHKKSYVMNEVYIGSIIEEHGLNIPKILEIKQIDGCWSTVSEYIEGDTLDKLMEKNPEKTDEYLKLFVDLRARYRHEKSTALRRLKDKLRHRIQKCSLSATRRYDMYIRLGTMPKSHTICHGDYNPSNVIIGKDSKAYIIDWSHATRGNGAADAAMTYLLFVLEGKTELAAKYLDLYCETRGTEREAIEKYIPIVAASHSVECDESEIEKLLEIASV